MKTIAFVLSVAMLASVTSHASMATSKTASYAGRFDGHYKLLHASAKVSSQYVLAKPCIEELNISHRVDQITGLPTIVVSSKVNQGELRAVDQIFFSGTPNWSFVYRSNGGNPVASELSFIDKNEKENDCGSFIGCQLQGHTMVANGYSISSRPDSISGSGWQIEGSGHAKLEIGLQLESNKLDYKLNYLRHTGEGFPDDRAKVTCKYLKL